MTPFHTTFICLTCKWSQRRPDLECFVLCRHSGLYHTGLSDAVKTQTLFFSKLHFFDIFFEKEVPIVIDKLMKFMFSYLRLSLTERQYLIETRKR